MQNTGERQVGTRLEDIKADHLRRYEFARDMVSGAVVDAACGTGYGALVMAKSPAVGSVLALDISVEALTHGDEWFPHYKVQREYADLQAEGAEWPELAFDHAVSFETIEHLEHPETLLRQLYRASHNLIASVPNESVIPFTPESHPFHVRHYTKGEFEALLNECGWHVTTWLTQHDKVPGEITSGDDGRFLIVLAERMEKAA